VITLDHVGFAVTDYRRSKDFYEKALAPLGIKLLIEFSGGITPTTTAATCSIRTATTSRPSATIPARRIASDDV
jgi:catechol 2,3-dioxygenase-like lactoylglutathione lyase family enzyme